MNDFYKDILIGAVFVTGLIGFISGEFIISSALFASAAIASNVNMNRKRVDTGHLSCDWFLYLNCLTKRLKNFQGLTALEVFCFLCFLLLHNSLNPPAQHQFCHFWRNPLHHSNVSTHSAAPREAHFIAGTLPPFIQRVISTEWFYESRLILSDLPVSSVRCRT